MEINKDIADLELAENRKRMAKKFVLCYHNFNVKNCKRASTEIRKIAAAVGSPITIAVVPSIGGVPESEAEYFCEQIEQFIQDGYEIVLHGARHRADLFVKRSFFGKVALWLSHNGAEFAGLSKRFSQALLDRGMALWNAHGLGKASGFVPPVWIDNKYLRAQALKHFDNYEDMICIYKKKGENVKTFGSPLITFSALPKFLLGPYMAIACFIFWAPAGTPRLVFHSEDFRNLGEKRVLSMVRYAAVMRENVKYKDL